MQPKSIVITGVTGIIGTALARTAIQEGIAVLCIARRDSDRLRNIPQSDLISVEYCNVNEYNKLNLNGRYDVFFHLAWEKTHGTSRDDTDKQADNIRHTLDAVRLAKRIGCKKFVGAGSQAEYGIVNEALKPGTSANPESGYGIAKYAAGKLSQLLCLQLGLEFNWVRVLSVFGPAGGADTLIMYAINELQAGRSPELTKCEQIWDYLYSSDAAKAFLTIGKNGVDGKTYPLGSGIGKKLSEYIESIRDIINPNLALHFGRKEYYSHQPMYLYADISELTADTGWEPAVSFGDGIRDMVYPRT